MRRGLALALLIGTALLPTAAAASAAIDVTALNATLPSSTSARHVPIALFVRESSSLLGFGGDLATVEISYFEKTETFVDTGLMPGVRVENPGRIEQTWSANAATIRLASGGHAGFLGADLSEQGLLTTAANDDTTVESRPPGIFPDGTIRASAPDDVPLYAQRVIRAFLLHNVTGQIAYEGPGELKIVGPDIEIVTPHNATRYETGAFPEGQAQIRFKWLHIRFRTAVLTLDSGEPVEVATTGVSFQAEGLVHANVIRGEIKMGEEVYPADPGPNDFEGTFSGELSPSGGSSVRMILNGDLRRTTMAAVPVPAPPGGGLGASWLALIAGAAIVAAGGGFAAYQWHRSHQAARVALEPSEREHNLAYCLYYAQAANDLDEYELTLEWLSEALEFSKDDPEIMEWQAFMLRALGDLRAAADLMDDVTVVAPWEDGEPSYWAAAFQMEIAAGDERLRENAHQDARRHLEQALQRQPMLVGRVQRDPLFGPLADEDFKAMVEEAHACLEGRIVGER